MVIKKIWAYLAIGPGGEEGIAAFQSGGVDTWMPMTCSCEETIKKLKPVAIQIRKKSGCKMKLVCFSERTDIEEI